jgi:O-antigen/teichoic acid export membrane protein
MAEAPRASVERGPRDPKDGAERDARDLNRGLFVNLLGYVLKLAQPAMLVWVVRVYGAEGWGQYTVSEAVLLVVLRVILIGFDKTLLWWVPRMDQAGGSLPHLRGALYGTLALAATGSLLVGTLLASPLASWRGASEAASALQWMAWSLVPMTAMELFISAALGKRRVESQVLIRDALVSLSFVLLALAFFYGGLHHHGLSLAHFTANTLGALASGVVFVRLYGAGGLLGRPRMPPREVLRYALPAWGVELISSFSQRMDVFAVSYFGTPAAAGIYGVVVRVGNAVRSVRRSYDPIVTTIMSDIAASGDKARLRAAFSRATVLVMLTQTPIFAGLALFADELAPLFGEGFEQAALPILVICGFWLLNGAFGLNGLIVSGYGRSDLILIDLVISTVVLAALLFALVPGYGPLGASIALGLTYLITNLIQVAQAHFLAGINPYNATVARAAVAALCALAAGGLALWLTADLARITGQLIAAACFGLVLLAFQPRRLLAG